MRFFCKQAASFGKGIGSHSRFQIVEALIKGPRTVSELVRASSISQSAVSQHLKILKLHGLVQDERQGREVVYILNTSHMLEFLRGLSEQIQKAQTLLEGRKGTGTFPHRTLTTQR